MFIAQTNMKIKNKILLNSDNNVCAINVKKNDKISLSLNSLSLKFKKNQLGIYPNKLFKDIKWRLKVKKYNKNSL